MTTMRSLIDLFEGFPSDADKIDNPVPLSPHDVVDLMGEWDRHETDSDASPERVLVDPAQLRATQEWLDRRWAPGTFTKNESKPGSDPFGIRTPDGGVHLIDGHHRASHAFASGSPIGVQVYDSETIPPRRYYNQRDQRARDERRIANDAARRAREAR